MWQNLKITEGCNDYKKTERLANKLLGKIKSVTFNGL